MERHQEHEPHLCGDESGHLAGLPEAAAAAHPQPASYWYATYFIPAT